MANDSGSVVLALLVGAVIGAGAGILYAPDEGSKTRELLKDKAREGADEIKQRVSEARRKVETSARKQQKEFEKDLDEAISKFSHRADEVLAGLERRLEELRQENAKLQK